MSKTIKALLALAFWIFVGILIYLIDRSLALPDDLKGAWLLLLLILMGLCAGFLKEKNHDTIFVANDKERTR